MTRRHLLTGLLQLLVSAGIIGWLVTVVGVGPIIEAARSLSLQSIGAALILGAAATIIQAQRWRLVSRGFGMELGRAEALAKCWQASFLNSVLPGGLAGDAVRAVDQREHPNGSWRGGVGSVVGERLAGTVIILAAASVAVLPRDLGLGTAVGAVAVIIAACAWPSLRRLSWSSRLGVVGLSFAGWVAFVLLFAVATLGGMNDARNAPEFTEMAWSDVVGLAAVSLAGMSVPLSWGGWGPREGAAAFGFVLFGYTAEQGVAVSVSYGILALVSVSPGALVLLHRFLSGWRARKTPGSEIELSTHVVAEREAADRCGKSSG